MIIRLGSKSILHTKLIKIYNPILNITPVH